MSNPKVSTSAEHIIHVKNDSEYILYAMSVSRQLSYDDKVPAKHVIRELCHRLDSFMPGRVYKEGNIILGFGRVRWIKSNGQARYLTYFEKLKYRFTGKTPDGLTPNMASRKTDKCKTCAWGNGKYCCNDGTNDRAEEPANDNR